MPLILTPGALALVRPFIEQKEGLRLHAYQDTGGIWTIGYGETGPHIVEGLIWTEEQADDALTERITDFASRVGVLVHVPLSDHQAAALISFAYNTGVGNFQSSTLLRLLNEGGYSAVHAQLLRWCHDHAGHLLAGLQIRREEEGEMFDTPDTPALAA